MCPKTPAAEIASAAPCSSRIARADSSVKKSCSVGIPCSFAMRTGSPEGSMPRKRTPWGTKPLSSVPSFEPMSTANESGPSEPTSTSRRARPCKCSVAVLVVPLTKGKFL